MRIDVGIICKTQDVSTRLAKDAIREKMYEALCKYPQYNGYYSDNNGWRLAVILSDIGWPEIDGIRPFKLVLARARTHFGEIEVEIAMYRESSTLNPDADVYPFVISVHSGNVTGQCIENLMWLEQ